MFSLKSRHDSYRLVFPKEFIAEELQEKYTNILTEAHGYFVTPIDFLNESIQSIQVLGFQQATVQQQQTYRGSKATSEERMPMNRFLFPSNDFNYRSEVSPVALIDKTLNVTFRHTLGFINYFLLFENFFWQYARDTKYEDLVPALYIDIADYTGAIYARIELQTPIMDSMDMLDLNFTQPVAASQTFQVQFKYSNIDFQFISNDNEHSDDLYNSPEYINDTTV